MGAPLPGDGDVLAGKYKIIRVIGRGGMGVVFEAMHLRLHQRVALKMLLPEIANDPELVARFEREARAAAKLQSPRVTKVLDVDVTPDGVPYMVMEFLEGHDLDTELQVRGSFPIAEAVAIIMEACVPIAEAHANGIVHRDLKPSNLFLHQKDGERSLKLLDFGISKVFGGDAKETSSFQVLGTPLYMSPEQVRHAAIDARTDIWSLGIILYEMITGTVPYPEDNPSAVIAAIAADPITPPGMLRPDVPAELEVVIMRALQKDPNKRFRDIRTFAAALAPFAPEEELVTFTATEAYSGARLSRPDAFEVVPRVSRPDAPTEPPPPMSPRPPLPPWGDMLSPSPPPQRTTPIEMRYSPPPPPVPRFSPPPDRMTPSTLRLESVRGVDISRDSSRHSEKPPAKTPWMVIAIASTLVAVVAIVAVVRLRSATPSTHTPAVVHSIVIEPSAPLPVATPSVSAAPVLSASATSSSAVRPTARPRASAAPRPSASVEQNPLTL